MCKRSQIDRVLVSIKVLRFPFSIHGETMPVEVGPRSKEGPEYVIIPRKGTMLS